MLGDFDDEMGGLQTAVLVMANAQAAAGAHVTIAAGVNPGATFENARALDARVDKHLFPHSPVLGRLGGSRGLGRWLWRTVREVDAVHIHSLWNIPAVLAAAVAIARGVRLVVSPHGSLEPYDLRKHERVKRVLGPVFLRPLLARSDVVLCTTSREEANLRAFGAKPRTRVLQIPPGPPLRGKKSRGEFRNALGISDATSLLLFLGRIDEKKGLDILIDAFAQIAPGLDVTLLIVGSGDEQLEASLRQRASRLPAGRRVVWGGWLSGQDKADAYRAADLFVLLSHNENYGITVIEAAQAELPVVLTEDVYSADELLAVGAACLTTRVVSDAAGALTRAIGDPEVRGSLMAGARAFASQRSNVDALQQSYFDLITS